MTTRLRNLFRKSWVLMAHLKNLLTKSTCRLSQIFRLLLWKTTVAFIFLKLFYGTHVSTRRVLFSFMLSECLNKGIDKDRWSKNEIYLIRQIRCKFDVFVFDANISKFTNEVNSIEEREIVRGLMKLWSYMYFLIQNFWFKWVSEENCLFLCISI